MQNCFCSFVLIFILIVIVVSFVNIEGYGQIKYGFFKIPKKFNDLITSSEGKEIKFPNSLGEFQNKGEGAWEANTAYDCSWSNPGWTGIQQGAERCAADKTCDGFQLYKSGTGHCLFKDISDAPVDISSRNGKKMVRFERKSFKEKPINSFVRLEKGSWKNKGGNAIAYDCGSKYMGNSPEEAAAKCKKDIRCDGFVFDGTKPECMYQNTTNAKIIKSGKTRYTRLTPRGLCQARGKHWVNTPSGKFECQNLKIL